jgi:hypothetical protein
VALYKISMRSTARRRWGTVIRAWFVRHRHSESPVDVAERRAAELRLFSSPTQRLPRFSLVQVPPANPLAATNPPPVPAQSGPPAAEGLAAQELAAERVPPTAKPSPRPTPAVTRTSMPSSPPRPRRAYPNAYRAR